MPDSFEWVAPSGTVHTLDASNGVIVIPGVAGRWMPPAEITRDEVAGLNGSRVRQVRFSDRDVTLPMLVHGSGLRDRLRTLVRLFDPTSGDGTLRVTPDEGDPVELVCRYTEGMGLEEGGRQSGAEWQRMVVVLTAHEPLWRDANPVVAVIAVESPSFFPLPPLQLAEDRAADEWVEDNDGDALTWPIWTVQGPGTSPRLVNETYGDEIEVATTLIAGQQLHIDTRPGRKTVTVGGESLYSDLTDDSVLWPLRQGSQMLSASLESATSESRIRLEYRRLRLTP